MSPSSANSSRSTAPPDALARFLRRVLREQAKLREELLPDSVHDLRVALRRCRSLAEGFATLDDHSAWRRLRKSAKQLQAGMANLRDAQVMAEGVRRLHLVGGPDGAALAKSLERDERKGRREAKRALKEFPRKRWKRWRRRLPKIAERIGCSPASFADLVLERATEAAAREHRWRGSESQVAAHSLRIAVKHFRYTVQSFLPEHYAAWERDLKRMQDALGDIHDLDVLRGWILKVSKKDSLNQKIVHEWLRRIHDSRLERVEQYKKAVSAPGKGSEHGKRAVTRWERWRREVEQLAELNPQSYGPASA